MNLKTLSMLQLIPILFFIANTALASIDATNYTDQPEELGLNNFDSQINCFYKSFPRKAINVKTVITALAICSIEKNQGACTNDLIKIVKDFKRAYPCFNSSCMGHDEINLESNRNLYLCTKTNSQCISTQIFEFKNSYKISLPRKQKTTAYHYTFLNKTTTINGSKSLISEEILVCFQD